MSEEEGQRPGGDPEPHLDPTENGLEGEVTTERSYPNGTNPKMRYMKPYWWPYRTFVKHRWIGRRLLEVVSTEFRDRSVEYYKHALESGVTKVNGNIAGPDYVLKDGDRIDNTVHRHEPPVTNNPILVLHLDEERQFVVISKPGSLPIHATGRYFRHTLLELLKSDFGIDAHAVNRLDRLTSGLMILALNGSAARDLATEFSEGKVKKEYVARVRGRFPDEEITVDQPLLTIDRQMGLVIVAPEGKEAVTIFKRLVYDQERDQSVVLCRPQTGRTHQIRVHLQYLGHPIANDPLYGISDVWGTDLGRGGVELVKHPVAITVESRQSQGIANGSTHGVESGVTDETQPEETLADKASRINLEDRDGMSIDMASPIPLSSQAKEIIRKLRRMKDEQEDWIKWKEVVFTAKAAQDVMEARDATGSSQAQNAAKARGASSAAANFEAISTISETATPAYSSPPTPTPGESTAGPSTPIRSATPSPPPPPSGALLPTTSDLPVPTSANSASSGSAPAPAPSTRAPRIPRVPGEKRPRKKRTKLPLPEPLPDDTPSPLPRPSYLPPGFCETCFVPLPDDPDLEKLFIYLHALRYTTERLGRWETPMPRWAGEGWKGDWRGWVDPPDHGLPLAE